MLLRLSEGCVVELQMKVHMKVWKHREDPYEDLHRVEKQVLNRR